MKCDLEFKKSKLKGLVKLEFGFSTLKLEQHIGDF